MNVTPEILRSIADTLVPFNEVNRYLGEYYICISAVDFHCIEAVQELLSEGGLWDLTGCLGYPDGSKEYADNAMSIRFMYLEFLALYLESESVL